MQRSILFCLACTLCVILCAAPLSALAAERTHDIVPEDYFDIGVMTGCAVSPYGKYIAYTESRWDEAAGGRANDLWVVECATREIRRLTFDPANDGSPKWSPDGTYIYFRTSRERGEGAKPPYNGKTQVWRISPAGGEPFAVTRLEDGIGMYDLSKDGKTLYYTVSTESVDGDFADLKKQYADLEYGHGVHDFSQVWKMDLVHWRAEKIIDEKRVIKSFVVSPDERRVAMITTPTEKAITNEGWSRVDLWEAETGEITSLPDKQWREDAPSPYSWLGDLHWSDNSEALVMSASWDGYPTEVYVTELAGERISTFKIDRLNEVEVTGSIRWRPGSRDLYFLAEDHARARLYRVDEVKNGRQGATHVVSPGDVVVTSFDVPKTGNRAVVVSQTTTNTRDLFWADGKRMEQITKVNPQVDTWKLPQISIVKWIGANGDQVEGVLELPPDYKEGDGPLPMIVELHGGPTVSTLYRMRLWIYGRTLMAAKGYALLSPNYRGSTGYGDKFLTGLIGHENDVEVKDILAGVDAMIERGLADPDRLGVMGWSNGGLLTNCLITTTTRFKAASSGAGVLDMMMQWGSEDTPGHVINYMNGNLPWENPEEYLESSPSYKMGNITTPTIIHVGGGDPRCPADQSRALYRAMKHYLGVPCELIVYPGEGHGLTKYKSRLAKMEWDLAWFERYLLGKTNEENAEGKKD